jgi:asparagine synthetase B (glutamine-hydrolysing)
MVRLVALRGIYGEKAGGLWLNQELQRRLAEQKQRVARETLKPRSDLRIGLKERLMSLEGAFPAIAREMMERMASTASIELRSPFRSKAFIEFALGLPLTQLRRTRSNRYIHRKAMTGLLPDVVRQRTNKAEFSVVYAPHIDQLSKRALPECGPASFWIDPKKFAAVQRDAQRPTFDQKQPSPHMLLQLDCCAAALDRAYLLGE